MSNKLLEARQLAVNDCLAHEARTQCEYGIFIDANGDRIFETSGKVSHVEITDEQSEIMRQYPRGLFIHNHPSGGALSQQDIAFATFHHCEAWAVTKDGSCFATTGLTHGLPDREEGQRLDSMLERCSLDYLMHVGKHMQQDAPFRSFANGEAHFELCRMRDAGVLDYRYQLSLATERLYCKLELETGNSQEIILHDERELA